MTSDSLAMCTRHHYPLLAHSCPSRRRAAPVGDHPPFLPLTPVLSNYEFTSCLFRSASWVFRSYKWTPTIGVLWCLASLTLHDIFLVPPCCTVTQDFTLFYGGLAFHCWVVPLLLFWAERSIRQSGAAEGRGRWGDGAGCEWVVSPKCASHLGNIVCVDTELTELASGCGYKVSHPHWSGMLDFSSLKGNSVIFERVAMGINWSMYL